MKLSRVAVGIALSGVFAVAAAPARAQEPPVPKPGPEHDVFKMDEGTWDATVEFAPGPGAPPMTSKGTEVDRIGCGGLCLINDFKGEMMPGVMFEGHGLSTWDPAKKKYVGSWTDSFSRGLAVSEATWDPAAKQMKGWMEGPDMTGTVVKTRSVAEYRSDGTRVMTAFATGPDGKEMQVLRITYTRRK